MIQFFNFPAKIHFLFGNIIYQKAYIRFVFRRINIENKKFESFNPFDNLNMFF